MTHGTSTTLPQVLADWCLTDQDRLAPGDTYSVVDEATGTAYFAVLEGFLAPPARPRTPSRP